MAKNTLLPLLSILLLTFAVGGVYALERAELPAEPTSVEAQAVALETELLIEEAPLMSVDREPEAAANSDPLQPDTDWWLGICWTSCWPCNSDADCPWGQTCRFNVQCP